MITICKMALWPLLVVFFVFFFNLLVNLHIRIFILKYNYSDFIDYSSKTRNSLEIGRQFRRPVIRSFWAFTGHLKTLKILRDQTDTRQTHTETIKCTSPSKCEEWVRLLSFCGDLTFFKTNFMLCCTLPARVEELHIHSMVPACVGSTMGTHHGKRLRLSDPVLLTTTILTRWELSGHHL